MRNKVLLYIALILATVAWGGTFVGVKYALRYLNPLQLLFVRFVPAALAYATSVGLWYRQTLPRMISADWRSLCLMGLFGVILYHLPLNLGQKLIPAGTASLLMAVNPAFIMLFSVAFLKEQASRTRVLGLVISFLGLVLVMRFPSSGHVDLRYLGGLLISLVGPMSWALYTVISRPLAARYPPLAVTGVATILGAMPILAFLGPSSLSAAANMPWDGWVSVLFLALVSTVVGVSVWVLALQHLEASRVGAFIYLVPFWGVLLSRILLAEPLTPALLAGGAVVIAGVVLVNHQGQASSTQRHN